MGGQVNISVLQNKWDTACCERKYTVNGNVPLNTCLQKTLS